LIIVFNHNHPINAAEVLRRRDVGVDVQAKFQRLFEAGYSPRSALEMHRYDLQMEHGDEYATKATDRRYCPDMQWCFRKYYQIFKADGDASSSSSERNVKTTLQQRVEKYNEEHGEKSIASSFSEHGIVVAMCSPLMKRVHRALQQAGELVFVDSLSSGACHVYMFMVNCEAGGLPLGIVVSTSDEETALIEGFELLKTLFPIDAFYGRGESGPQYFMTDDCATERNALTAAFPLSLSLLCQHHVLWAAWRWLWSDTSQVETQHRNGLYRLIEDAVRAQTYEALADAFTKVHYDETANQYGEFIAYVDQLLEKSTLWASCYRQDDSLRNLNTDNTVETSVRIVKDKIFKRLKAFNLVHLVDFAMTKMEQYFERRLISIANGRLDKLKQTRSFPKDGKIILENVWRVQPDVIMVPKDAFSTAAYYVNATSWICSCPEGSNGAPCGHQWAALIKYQIECVYILPITNLATRKLFMYIASGIEDLPPDLFGSFHHDHNENVAQAVATVTSSEHHESVEHVSLDMESTPIIDDEDVGERVHRLQIVEHRLQAFTASLSEKMQQYPTVYLPAVEAFLNSYARLATKTNAGVLTALHCFGKYSGASRAGSGSKRKAIDFV
jgi:hypothetical protein